MFKKMKEGLSNLFKTTLSEKNMDEILNDLKLTLLKNDVAVLAAEKICEETEANLKGQKVGAFSKKDVLANAIQDAIYDILKVEQQFDLIDLIKNRENPNRPYVILILGVNGTGKTTTIAKIAHLCKKNDVSVVVAASDTFRAGAIEQLETHMKRVGVPIIKQNYKADPASVGYDAIEHAIARHIQSVIIDTSGRQVTNKNLLEELKKIKRINQPDLTVFVGDSLAGNDVLFQAEQFNQMVGIDASIITKLDADSKGGAALSIAFITKKPIIYIGVGQGYDDLLPFNSDWFIEKITGSKVTKKN
jgi:fused signal recognition particle receptor